LAYQPKFNNSSDFSGKIIHAQYWDSAIIHQNKSVVVIGSGATAYTLVPELAKQAKHVTMIQRSPTYVRSESDNPQWLQQIRSNYDSELTIHLAARNESITRQKNQYHICRERPVPMRRILINDVKKELAEDIDIKHFTPTYMPWDQRICTIVNNDFIKCVNTGKVTIETDTIESFTKTGIVLASGTEVQADIVIMATGFETRIIGDVVVRINNNTIDISQLKAYKGSMIEGLPNFGYVFGYASMSWTLKLELTLEYFSKVFDFMTEHNHTACVPIDDCRIQGDSGFIGLSSSFYLRNEAKFPRQGASKPWVNTNNFDDDRTMLLEEPVNDGILKFI
jgi:cation diffusion facilitator CzcD-associated flavoprotein CzcO